jgi:hypothetical protein
VTDPHPLLVVDSANTFWAWSIASERRKSELIHGWQEARLVVRSVRGRKMTTTAQLYDEFAAALQFPPYFGENWAAFDECLSDMD